MSDDALTQEQIDAEWEAAHEARVRALNAALRRLRDLT